MKYKSNFMSFLAVTAICLTLFSFKSGNDVEKELGISKEIVMPDVLLQESPEEQRLRRAWEGAKKAAKKARDAAGRAAEVVGAWEIVTWLLEGEMIEAAPDSEELTLMKKTELGKL